MKRISLTALLSLLLTLSLLFSACQPAPLPSQSESESGSLSESESVGSSESESGSLSESESESAENSDSASDSVGSESTSESIPDSTPESESGDESTPDSEGGDESTPESEPTPPAPKGTLVLSEFCPDGKDVVSGHKGYVELYNPTEYSASLSDFTLTVSVGGAGSVLSMNGEVAGGAYAVVYLNADYKSGAAIILETPDGEESTLVAPSVPTNLSYTLVDGGWRLTTPTPDTDNGEAIESYLIINEVCSKNQTAIANSQGKHPDYIEFLNRSPYPLYLDGFIFSDNKDPGEGYRLDGAVIEAGGYFILFADADSMLPFHAPFGISASGEKVYLFDPHGAQIQKVDVPALAADTAWGRYPDGGDFRVLEPTPGGANNAKQLPVAMPVFSLESGFYDDPFDLTVTAEEGYTIYYTVDGSTPTAFSPIFPSSLRITDKSPEPNGISAIRTITPISGVGSFIPSEPVDKCTVVKIIAVSNTDPGRVSEVATAVYFVGYKDRAEYKDVAVMSFSTDERYLFDYDIGIYVMGAAYDNNRGKNPSGDTHVTAMANYKHSGRAWEREVTMTYFDADGTFSFNQDIGIRIHGGWSRGFNQKSFNLYARADYSGTDTFGKPFFGTETLKTCMLRTGGYRDTFLTKFRDPLNQDLAVGRDFATMRSLPCMLFINGEFWGLYALQERFTENYCAEYYDVDKDNVVIICNSALDVGTPEDKAAFDEFVIWMHRTDMSVGANYEKAKTLIDVESFIDYMAHEIWVGNVDWPNNNMRMWRTRTAEEGNEYGDCRWRFMFYDTDDSSNVPDCGGKCQAHTDSFLPEGHWSGSPMTTDGTLGKLFCSLLKSDEFRMQFATTFCDMANTNLNYEKSVHPMIVKLANEYRLGMVAFYDRFVSHADSYNVSYFDSQVKIMDDYFRDRAGYIMGYMVKHMKIDGTKTTFTLLADGDKGSVRLNTVTPDLSSGKFEGMWYKGLSVECEATPADGYRLSHWEVTKNGVTTVINDTVLTLQMNGTAVTVTPVYEEI